MKRDVKTINDLTNDEMLRLFKLADHYLSLMADAEIPYRIARPGPTVQGGLQPGTKRHEVTQLAKGAIVATLFYERSTRTRFSFEAAMQRLGGGVLSFGDPNTTSVGKGETLADTVRVMENYADLIVLRHPTEGASEVAAEFSRFPVINAGDGAHEHPTQTLCDLYTLHREKKALDGLRVLLCGDLKNGRTIHSLVYGLARFGMQIATWAGKGLGLPVHVQRRLEQEFHVTVTPFEERGQRHDTATPQIDAIYQTPRFPHQKTLFTETYDLDVVGQFLNKLDALYVTRYQSEREKQSQGAVEYPIIDKKFLKPYKSASVMHPLPRVNELGYDLDRDPRGTYFRQASYAVAIRMALIASLLKLPGAEDVLDAEAPKSKHPVYRGHRSPKCLNRMCITNVPRDRAQVKQKFWIIQEDPLLIRCAYCEHERGPHFRQANSDREQAGSEETTSSSGDLCGGIAGMGSSPPH